MDYKEVKELIVQKINTLIDKKSLEFDEYRIIDSNSWMSVYKYKSSKFYLYFHSTKDSEEYLIGFNSILLPLEDIELVDKIKNYISGVDIEILQKIK